MVTSASVARIRVTRERNRTSHMVTTAPAATEGRFYFSSMQPIRNDAKHHNYCHQQICDKPNILTDIDDSLSDKIIINLRVGYGPFPRLTPLRKPRQSRHS